MTLFSNTRENRGPSEHVEESIVGVLRAVHLDRDWIELTVGNDHIRITQVGEAVDDVIGPMVNHSVVVRVVRESENRLLFRDIEEE